MALVPIRVDRTSKPPIGTHLRSDGHWSVQGLVGAWAFNEGAGKSAFDAVTGKPGQTRGVRPWSDPRGLYGDGVAPEGIYLPNAVSVTANESIIVCGDFRVFNSNINLVAFGPLSLSILSTGAVRSLISTSGGYPSATSNTLSGPVSSIATLFRGIVTAPRIIVDGVEGTPTSAGSGVIGTSLSCSIGCAPTNDYGAVLNGVISGVFRHRGLTFDQVASLSSNPWQIYEPETIWIEVGGGGEQSLFAGTIYGQSSASAQLSTAITIASQVVAAGNISGGLTTAIVLAGAAQGEATAQAALETALELAAQVNGSSDASAALTTAIELIGVAAGQCLVSGRLAEPTQILEQLRVLARDPLALSISASDPLALRISVRDPLSLRVTVH